MIEGTMSSPAHLFIVDDDAALGKTLMAILTKEGYQAEWVPSGKEMLKRLETAADPLQIALVDLGLPDMHGLDLLKTMRKRRPDMPVLVITGNAGIETAIAALNAGAFAYLLKPYNVDEVKSTIARAVEKQWLIMENRNLMHQLMELNKALDSRVQERTEDLQEANLKLASTITELQSTEKAKEEFFAMASHELRTPLTVIIGVAGSLLMRMDELKLEEIRRYLGLLDVDAHRLLQLINQILDMAQIKKSGVSLTYSRFDVRAHLTSLVESFRLSHPDVAMELSISETVREMYSDKDRVNQILMNLIGNAVKYAPKGGQVQVNAFERGTDLVFHITDTGPGIAGNALDKIFEPFYRTPDAEKSFSVGTGLGLAIAKAIVDAFGGTICAKNRKPHGAEFICTLPNRMERKNPAEQMFKPAA